MAELTAALRSGTDTDVRVRAFGAFRDEADVWGYRTPAGLEQANGALQALGTDVAIAADVEGADLVHSHTWYANSAGRIAQLTYGIPHVVTAHSLEPLRPWKAEQLGGGYRLSSWMEREAFENADGVIAVSKAMRADILRSYPSIDPSKVHVVYNGIDIDAWKPQVDEDAVRALGIDPSRPSVVFVGRITRQKGLPYLLRAVASLPEDVQIVLCAGAPDTPEILAEVTGLVEGLREQREGVVWIDRMLAHEEIVNVLSSGTVFVCPSIYEPLGIVNLEAMACGIPVVGTGTGGIPEVVADGFTGRIVPIDQAQDGTGTPTDPDKYVADLAATLNEVLADEGLAKLMGRAGRLRVESEFTWDAIATRTRQVYDEVLGRTP
ncbi:glycogen synthase (ADP-glucose) [Curtobacterium sp. PhB128]|nr:glycogen synthase (ADP-glucose) [Curtobacterium sp. PhB128]TCL99018.1 glycogen synthase (ADP-glucose) [Curtobacterium sp. PhB138]TCU84414.1 glycogen synthase (ADP-glucose) [Curtobacterium sp. PhB191]TDW52962.1 glycogen synthase (ADP-glucose) [Curtobacterium sp. PhB42]TDW58268.1 glycogen synthase (ADP-glucose) [Curtobacterium sp. PhB190]TDW74580.1 glycogen synthase (ADP-glucose) [Curtobacterium sp. PhB25]